MTAQTLLEGILYWTGPLLMRPLLSRLEMKLDQAEPYQMDMTQKKSREDCEETQELHWIKEKKKKIPNPCVAPAVIGLVWMASQVLVKMMW